MMSGRSAAIAIGRAMLSAGQAGGQFSGTGVSCGGMYAKLHDETVCLGERSTRTNLFSKEFKCAKPQ
jgi:hypothetical protein